MSTRIRRTTAAQDGPYALPYALEYGDPKRGWRVWGTFWTTLTAAWEAHAVFGAPRPGADS